MNKTHTSLMIEKVVSDVALKVMDIQRSFVWEDFREYILWRELASCILGSRVPFELARSAVRHLDKAGLLRMLQKERCFSVVEKRVLKELRRPLYFPLRVDGSKRSYTFPFVKARQLRDTAKTIYGEGKTLKSILRESKDEYFARKFLIETAAGIGPKQASLFLRNIGFANDLAILDSHVLRFMDYVKIAKILPDSISSITSYEKTESKLRNYAEDKEIEMSCLDTAIWIVMRVYQKEFAI
jgi:N-glycosylase/DNA lyase